VNEITVRLFVESWTTCWTLVLGLGYIGQALAWPNLSILGSDRVARLLVLASFPVVLALGMGGFPPAALMIAAWVIAVNLIRAIVSSAA
jgi:hypothetical protein